MLRNHLIMLAGALALGGVSTNAIGQDAQTQATEREAELRAREAELGARRSELEARRSEQEAQRAELDQARQRLEAARRELEVAAREVAQRSARINRPVVAVATDRPWRVPFGVLGINIYPAPDNAGVRVLGVTPGGPAAEAGVATGDVITAIDDVTLAGSNGAVNLLLAHMADVEPEQGVVLHIERDGAARDVTVVARDAASNTFFLGGPGNFVFSGVAPAEPAAPGAPGTAVTVGPDGGFVWSSGPGGRNFDPLRFDRLLVTRWHDMELVALTPELGRYFGTDEGLLVVRAPDDDAIGLEDGDVILEIGGREPADPAHAMRILMSFDPGETLRLSIVRRERRQTVEYVIPGE